MPIFFLEWAIYPRSFIKCSKIKEIVLCNSINFYSFGKTHIPEYRAGCPETMMTNSLLFSLQERNFVYIRLVIHHELFHFIDWIDDYSYEDKKWNTFNMPGFKYGKGGQSERVWIQLDEHTKGFINHYSTTGSEEDRAEIYQYLIGCPDEALNHKDDIIVKKANHIKSFIVNFDKYGIGDKNKDFFNDLCDFRNKFPYKESVYTGCIQ